QNTTDFCEALKANNIKYVMDNTAEYLTTGADQPINLEKVWQKNNQRSGIISRNGREIELIGEAALCSGADCLPRRLSYLWT
ncbi:hypothetical protein KU710_23915, partial [Salmonella enterica subsp. enterica serovar Give]|nr:hypothetical protein [Salmonella enterica subsp. enterica serovar Give]